MIARTLALQDLSGQRPAQVGEVVPTMHDERGDSQGTSPDTGGRAFGGTLRAFTSICIHLRSSFRSLSAVLCMFFLSTLPTFAVQRFPRPEFETPYVQPFTTTPAARAQWLEWIDVAVLAAALSLAAYLCLQRRSRRGILALTIFSLLYFGFVRHGCICPVGSLQNLVLAWVDPGYAVPLTVVLLFSLPLVFALFFGRVFCAAVCPLGAIQDVVVVKPMQLPRWLNQALGMVRYVFLGFALLLAATGAGFIVCRWDPFVHFFRLGGPLPIVLCGVAVLLVGVVIARPYCRFFCPYGVILGWLSALTRWRVSITPDECIQCRLCEDACPFGAIRKPSPERVPETRGQGVRRLALLLCLLPILVVGGGWVGSRANVFLARMHPTFSLAEQIHGEEIGKLSEQTLESETFRTTGETVGDLLSDGVVVFRKFTLGGCLMGAFFGLVAGIKLITLATRRTRKDYEADPVACVSCARCYQFCPRENLRLRQLKGAIVEPSTGT